MEVLIDHGFEKGLRLFKLRSEPIIAEAKFRATGFESRQQRRRRKDYQAQRRRLKRVQEKVEEEPGQPKKHRLKWRFLRKK